MALYKYQSITGSPYGIAGYGSGIGYVGGGGGYGIQGMGCRGGGGSMVRFCLFLFLLCEKCRYLDKFSRTQIVLVSSLSFTSFFSNFGRLTSEIASEKKN